MRIGLVAALGAAVMLGGCAARQQVGSADGRAAVPNLPNDYRAVVADHVRKNFFDPYSIRDAEISSTADTTSIFGPVTNLCVRANAKNRLGAYTGVKANIYVFQSGKILNVLEDQAFGSSCANRSYTPFYEIDSAAKPPAPPVTAPFRSRR